jgi:hypothetical protein
VNRRAGVRLLIAAASIAMLAAVVAGMWAMGSPAHQRAVRLDDRRVMDLARLSNRIDSYWTQHKQLPAELHALDAANTFDNDPVSGTYTYAPHGEAAYQLCAVFDAASEADDTSRYGTPYQRDDWTHPAGRYCFARDASIHAHGY